MKRTAIGTAILLWAHYLVIAISGQERVPEPQTENSPVTATVNSDSAPENTSDWSHFSEVQIQTSSPSEPPVKELVQLLVTPDVFGNARPDLSDLRLFANDSAVIPFALRTLEARSIRNPIDVRRFNETELENGEREISLDLGDSGLEHNEIEITANGSEFRRRVVVESSQDGSDWRSLQNGFLLDLKDGDRRLEKNSLSYPDNRHRYLRLRVYPDREKQIDDKFIVTSIRVLQTIQLPGEMITADGTLGAREPVRIFGSPGSQWTISLGGDNVPVSEIEVDVIDREFARDIQILSEYPSYPPGRKVFHTISLTSDNTWQRRAGDPIKPLVVKFAEIQTSNLQIRIQDYRNAPLSIRSVKFRAAARQIVFESIHPAPTSLKVFFGNPLAVQPNYDFARNLPDKLDLVPKKLSLSSVTSNPSFIPPEQPLTERLPWLIYLVLATVSLILLSIIFNLARTAIDLHDSQMAQNSQ